MDVQLLLRNVDDKGEELRIQEGSGRGEMFNTTFLISSQSSSKCTGILLTYFSFSCEVRMKVHPSF